MLIFILAILLLLLLVNYMPLQYREGATNYQDYDETNCQTLAKQNQNNIDILQEDVKKLLDLQSTVDKLKLQLETNSTQLSSMADQVNNLPK